MYFASLAEWLKHIEQQHRITMDLGLARVKQVAAALDLLTPSYPVITVSGTNGKGSTVAILEHIYLLAGFRVGAFTSPYLYQFNELVRIQGTPVADADFMQAFQQIEQARAELTLTQFEFNTLAALLIFKQQKLEVGLLEVGLGGRLDAVNIIDADIAIVTSIAIDHTAWLGDTREQISFEKAGIFRSNRPAVCGDPEPPSRLIEHARAIGAPLFIQGQAFGFQQTGDRWCWWNQDTELTHLPIPGLTLQNMATALQAVALLQTRLPVSRDAIYRAMEQVRLPGRIQCVPGKVLQILDVAHNPAAAGLLAHYLRHHPIQGKTRAVFSMLADKDIAETIAMIQGEIDDWHIAPLACARGASLIELEQAFAHYPLATMHSHESIQQAHQAALACSESADRVIVFGSFFVVAGVFNLNSAVEIY